MLEQKLVAVDGAAEELAKAAKELVLVVKKLRQSSETGDLLQLQRGLSALRTLEDQLHAVNSSIATLFDFDAEAYLGSAAFLQELFEAATAQGVKASLGDSVLYSYPLAISVQPQRRSLLFGKRRESRIRPTFVAKSLKHLQSDFGRIPETSFLEVLYRAYNLLLQNTQLALGTVIPLAGIYELLTLLPTTARDYTKHDFSVDIYRLDKSSAQVTRDGYRVSLPASTGTRTTSGVLSIVSNTGAEVRYYGLAFSKVPSDVGKSV